MEGSVPVYLPRTEIDALTKAVLAFDREPLSEETLLKAVRLMSERLRLDIKEERSRNGDLQLRSKLGDILTVHVEAAHYHCNNYNVRQGDASEWDAKKNSEVVWRICGNPRVFIESAKPRDEH